ncbi:hypothetical protein LR48_Vigan10g184900 [Vigna angularis]|uniref:Uncharacterized protein n=1 Tax=Phaseolus angularis TaxID=3914 RepID=A0A0L9VM54_PHAAN|nr:hypothetical protein LR48_Vigan10g184900 [Vigna angularis]
MTKTEQSRPRSRRHDRDQVRYDQDRAVECITKNKQGMNESKWLDSKVVKLEGGEKFIRTVDSGKKEEEEHRMVERCKKEEQESRMSEDFEGSNRTTKGVEELKLTGLKSQYSNCSKPRR